MEKKGFYISEVLKRGWNVMKENIGFFIILLLLVSFIPYIPHAIAGALEKQHHDLIAFVAFLVYVFLNVLVEMGTTKISLDLSQGKKGELKHLFSQAPLFFNYLIAKILFSLIVFAGLILLVFPAFIWAAKFGLYSYFVIDKKAGPIEALKMSSKATMGAKWDMVGLYFLSLLIVLLGLLIFIVGVFAAAPTVIMAWAFVYRKLISQTPEFYTEISDTIHPSEIDTV